MHSHYIVFTRLGAFYEETNSKGKRTSFKVEVLSRDRVLDREKILKLSCAGCEVFGPAIGRCRLKLPPLIRFVYSALWVHDIDCLAFSHIRYPKTLVVLGS